LTDLPLHQGVFTIAKSAPASAKAAEKPADLLGLILRTLDDGKAEDVVVIELAGKSSLADQLVIASGRSSRQVTALADQVATKLKDAGYGRMPIEGKDHGDWVLLDAGDVILHLFRPEVRTFYNLEKMWGSTHLPVVEGGRTA
jgi:ribosome-associated protein